MSDGKEAKFIFVDDLSQPTSKTEKSVDAEIVRKWLEHTKGKCEFVIHEGAVYNVKNILKKQSKRKWQKILKKLSKKFTKQVGEHFHLTNFSKIWQDIMIYLMMSL